MHACREEDSLALLLLLLALVRLYTYIRVMLACDGQVLAFVASDCAAEEVPAQVLALYWVFLKYRELLSEVGVGIRRCVCEKYHVLILRESIGEREGVVVAGSSYSVLLVAVLVVSDVMTVPMPAHPLGFV